ncbi:MAG: response regulator transcription factor [Chloroflexi bacterium]|nr:response regulator transcription factor [Chloroflexota bacterium]
MRKIGILLAEDHAVVREGTRKLLESQPDFEVVGEAGDGEEAVELTKQLHPEVVIMDITMPKLSGIEATKQIKALYPSTAVLVLTGYDYDEYVFALIEAGAAGYLLKEATGDELIDAIRLVKAGEPAVHPRIMRKILDHLRTPVQEPAEIATAESLTEREMEVLRWAVKGMSNKEIADALCLSVRTVQAHLQNIFNKLGVGSRSEAIVYALKKGWLSLEELP